VRRSNHPPPHATSVAALLRPLIGRDAELVALHKAQAAGERFMVLVGAPGIGKTRLAHALCDTGEAVFCDCEYAHSTSQVIGIVARQLGGAPHTEPERAEDDLLDALADRGHLTLILDHADHLVREADRFARWCARISTLTIVITSRQRVANAWTFEVPPLECPMQGISANNAYPAVRYLVDSCMRVGARLDSSDEHVAALVRSTDGIPLALDLVAAELRTSTPRSLYERQAARATSRNALYRALETSYASLAPAEAKTFASLSLFRGAFTDDFAEAVFGPDTRSCLQALRDKSLLYQPEPGRLAMFESVHAFAKERAHALPTAERDVAALRMIEQLATLAEQFVRSRVQQDTRKMVFVETLKTAENLKHALNLAERAGMRRAATMIACALTWIQALSPDESVGAVSALLGVVTDANERAYLLLARQMVFNATGRYEASLDDLRAVVEAPDTDATLRAFAQCYIGIQLRYQGNSRAARPHHESVQQQSTNPYVLVGNEACLGRLYWDLGEFDAARTANKRAFAQAEQLGDEWTAALALANLAQLEQEERNPAEARGLLERAQTRLRRTGERSYEAFYAGVEGDLLLETGDYVQARAAYTRATQLSGRMLAHRPMVLLHGAFAIALHAVGDRALGEAHFDFAASHAARAQSLLLDCILDTHRVHIARLQGQTAESRFAAARIQELARESGDLRFALRLLQTRHLLAAKHTLELAHDARWFALNGSERVDLTRRAAMRKILLGLVQQKVPLGADAIAALGWPGERITVEAQSTRVRVAIATLRKVGLRDVLITRDGGYMLADGVRVVMLEG
jgi:tetratricopeptide (TPR) repeat protein